MVKKYKVYFDENNYMTGFVHTGTPQDIYEFDPTVIDDDFINAYKIIDGVPTLDEVRKAEIIEEREKEVSDLDRVEAQLLYTAMMTDTLLEEV